MIDLKTYLTEGFRLGKNKIDREDYDFVDLDLPSGTLWATSNVGATCGSTVKSWYGDYFVWGDIEPATNKRCDWNSYKYCNSSFYKLTKYCPKNITKYWGGTGKPDNKLTLDEEDDMANANMGGDWKIPTKEQLQELLDNTTSKWVRKYNDIQKLNGRLFTSKTNGNTLFIPAAGFRDNSVHLNGSYVAIWSSLLETTDPTAAYSIGSSSSDLSIRHPYRHYGISVRAVMN